jgi:hypothetical protein
MFLEVSIGEAIDKYSILEIKKKRITDAQKLNCITDELDALQDCKLHIDEYLFFYSLLVHINTVIWDTTAQVKQITLNGALLSDIELYAQLSYKIFEYNQMRFRIKNIFNLITSSVIKEQKSYKTNMCNVIIPNQEIIHDKIPEINYLLVKYDSITFTCDTISDEVIRRLFKNPNYTTESQLLVHPFGVRVMDSRSSVGMYDKSALHGTVNTETTNNTDTVCSDTTNTTINIMEFICIDDRTKYEFPPITYASGGLLGDFIHQLSVIHQKYLQTGRKGILYIANTGDPFRKGIVQTYNDTYDIIIGQSYIKDYKMHNGEQFDINLSSWRADPMLFRCNWNELYKKVYNVDWGTKPWLKLKEVLPEWENKIIINTSKFRFPEQINFNELITKYGVDNIIYIGFAEKEYNWFIMQTGINTIKFYKLTTLVEMCNIINSCKLMVGSLSAPMAFAHAMHKESIISCPRVDITMFKNLNVIPNLHIDKMN